MPTKSTNQIFSNKTFDKIAPASVKGGLKFNQFILDYADLPKIKHFKETYPVDVIYTLMEELYKAALCSPILDTWGTERRTEILLFYYDLQAATGELLSDIDDPE